MEASLKWGVTMCTHLFNAMPPFHPREPGIVGLLGSKFQPRPFLGLISDGVHVHPASVKLAAAARPDSIVLVSDGIVAMGLPEGQHHFGEVPVEIVSGDKAYRSGTTTRRRSLPLTSASAAFVSTPTARRYVLSRRRRSDRRRL